MKERLALVAEDITVATEDPTVPGANEITMKYLIRALLKYNASDLHIKSDRPPLYRINGKLVAARMPEFNQEQAKKVIYGVLTERQIRQLEAGRQVDLSFWFENMGRFRAHVYHQRGSVSAAIRTVPVSVPSIEELSLPSVVKELSQRQRGLLLVTGPTGSGKSTTLAALVRHLNETRNAHILMIEDPIEFVHRDIRSSVSQREIGSDALSFADALYGGLRQDPDVIVIGEMRDRETIQAALTAAETGHLVLSTLHTNDARSTVDRILDVFPADSQNQVRLQLASTLVGVVAQRLVLKANNQGRVPACEVMVRSPSIEQCLLRNEREKILDLIEASNTYYQMQSMNMALEKLVKRRIITAEEAFKTSSNPDDLKLKLEGIRRGEGYPLSGTRSGLR